MRLLLLLLLLSSALAIQGQIQFFENPDNLTASAGLLPHAGQSYHITSSIAGSSGPFYLPSDGKLTYDVACGETQTIALSNGEYTGATITLQPDCVTGHSFSPSMLPNGPGKCLFAESYAYRFDATGPTETDQLNFMMCSVTIPREPTVIPYVPRPTPKPDNYTFTADCTRTPADVVSPWQVRVTGLFMEGKGTVWLYMDELEIGKLSDGPINITFGCNQNRTLKALWPGGSKESFLYSRCYDVVCSDGHHGTEYEQTTEAYIDTMVNTTPNSWVGPLDIPSEKAVPPVDRPALHALPTIQPPNITVTPEQAEAYGRGTLVNIEYGDTAPTETPRDNEQSPEIKQTPTQMAVTPQPRGFIAELIESLLRWLFG